MKLIIAGSRSITAYFIIEAALDMFHIPFKEIVSGGAGGVDSLAIKFAEYYVAPYKVFKANWDELGKRAGFVRNAEMADYGDALLLIWDGQSKGSANMKEQMLKRGKPVYEVIITTTYHEPKA